MTARPARRGTGGMMDSQYQAMVETLRAHGYVADAEIATALYLADELAKPILIEGEAGVGKTEIAPRAGAHERHRIDPPAML